MVNNIQNVADKLQINPSSSSNGIVHGSVDNIFKVYHQNIRGIRNKTNELINSLLPELPKILCITEHHLKEHELERISIDHYNLGANFVEKKLKRWWSEYLCSRIIKFVNINIQEIGKEQYIEVCAIKIQLPTITICVTSVYRSPNGNFIHFIRKKHKGKDATKPT
jgi:regulator of RNase E activity RraB